MIYFVIVCVYTMYVNLTVIIEENQKRIFRLKTPGVERGE